MLARFGDKDVTVATGQSNTVWISNGTTIVPAAVTAGVSDGVYTELASASFGEGTRVVVR